MNIIISYDVRDEKRVRKVAKFLERECVRVQKSVFLLPQVKKNELKRIIDEFLEIVDGEDSIKVYNFQEDKVIANYEIKDFIV